jgi:predicted transcriptional regulator
MSRMMKRSNPEIMAEILNLCRKPQCRTRIMYKTSLSWEMLQRYLTQLQSRGLLEIHHSQTKYATTQKGLKFVEKWKELEEI